MTLFQHPVSGVVWWAFVPQTALACPVCYQSPTGNAFAYYATTLLLVLLPALLLGSAVWLIRRLLRGDQKNK